MVVVAVYARVGPEQVEVELRPPSPSFAVISTSRWSLGWICFGFAMARRSYVCGGFNGDR